MFGFVDHAVSVTTTQLCAPYNYICTLRLQAAGCLPCRGRAAFLCNSFFELLLKRHHLPSRPIEKERKV